MTNEIVNFPTGGSNKALYSTKELAEQLKTSPKVILGNTKKCLPNKLIENGKTTYFTEEEATVLLDYMKSNKQTIFNSQAKEPFTDGLRSTTTELTPILRLKQISQERDKLYNEEIEIYKNELKIEQEDHQKTKRELQYQTLSKEKYQELAWLEAERSKELEGYLDTRTEKQKRMARYVYSQD
jgi:hypothetical protein